MRICLVSLGLSVALGSWSAQSERFIPSPLRRWDECGLERAGLVCDPAAFLSANERSALSAALVRGSEETAGRQGPGRCAQAGLTLGVLLLDWLPVAGSPREVQDWAQRQRDAWRLDRSGCGLDVLLLLSTPDNSLYTAADLRTTSLNPSLQRAAFRSVVPLLRQGRYYQALSHVAQLYKRRYLETHRRPPPPTTTLAPAAVFRGGRKRLIGPSLPARRPVIRRRRPSKSSRDFVESSRLGRFPGSNLPVQSPSRYERRSADAQLHVGGPFGSGSAFNAYRGPSLPVPRPSFLPAAPVRPAWRPQPPKQWLLPTEVQYVEGPTIYVTERPFHQPRPYQPPHNITVVHQHFQETPLAFVQPPKTQTRTREDESDAFADRYNRRQPPGGSDGGGSGGSGLSSAEDEAQRTLDALTDGRVSLDDLLRKKEAGRSAEEGRNVVINVFVNNETSTTTQRPWTFPWALYPVRRTTTHRPTTTEGHELYLNLRSRTSGLLGPQGLILETLRRIVHQIPTWTNK